MKLSFFKLTIDLSGFDFTYGEVREFLEAAPNHFAEYEDLLCEGPDYNANPTTKTPNPWEESPDDKCSEIVLWIYAPKELNNAEAPFLIRAHSALIADFADWLDGKG